MFVIIEHLFELHGLLRDCHHCCQQNTSHSGSSQEDLDGALDNEAGRGGLIIINSGIHPPTFVDSCKSDGEWLDARRFCGMNLHDELVEWRNRSGIK